MPIAAAPSANAVTGAPSAPTSVSATAGSGTIALSWSTPTELSGQSITGYQVEYSTTGIDSWVTASNANVDVVANGGDATKSEVADAEYQASSAVTVAKISGTYGKSTLSKNDLTNLNKVIATVNKQGFDNVQITNITTTKLTATAAKARVDAMVNYIKSKIDNPDLVVTVVAPTTRTFTNQIAVK